MIRPARDYQTLLSQLSPGADATASMQRAVDALWNAFSTRGVSWVGFYLWSPTRPEELTLGPRRDKPACSPIGLHGACGRSFTSRRPLVVRDVAALGAGYIACDPRDRSEVVVPCLNPDGSAWGVLDVDSHDTGAFDESDARSLARLLHHCDLSARAFDDAAAVDVVG